MNATTNTAAPVINPYAWITDIYRDSDGEVDVISVRRADGLPFLHDAWAIADHVRKQCRKLGVDPGNQPPGFVKGNTVCVVRD